MSVGDFPMGVWQYKDVKDFADLKTFYNLPNDDKESTDSNGKRQSKKWVTVPVLEAIGSISRKVPAMITIIKPSAIICAWDIPFLRLLPVMAPPVTKIRKVHGVCQ